MSKGPEGFELSESFTFDVDRVKERMEFLEANKTMAWKTYVILLAAKDPAVTIDFLRPVKRTDLAELGNIFGIDPVSFFTVDDDVFQENQDHYLRGESDD